MPFDRPTFEQILVRVAEDIFGRMDAAGPELRRQCERLFAHALAAESHSLHGHLAHAARQSVPTLATDEGVILAWGRALLETPRKQPTRATGSAQFGGTDGSVIPAGTAMSLLVDSSRRFTSTAAGTIASGTVTVPIEADELGSDGNGDAGASVILTSPIVGVNSQGVIVSPGVTGGFDLEDVESVRERVVQRLRNPPRGGSPADFEAWAREVPGVDKAWGIPYLEGLGTIGVAIVRKSTTLEEWDVPDAQLLADTQAYIDSKAPAFMRSHPVIAPTLVPINFNVQLDPNTAAVQAAVEAEIRDLLLTEAVLGGLPWERANFDDPREPYTIPRTHVTEAISTSAGESDHVLVSPVGDLVAQQFELVVPGTFTFSDL